MPAAENDVVHVLDPRRVGGFRTLCGLDVAVGMTLARPYGPQPPAELACANCQQKRSELR